MMKFESDLVTSRDATGTPDLLDVWFDEQPTDQDWADYAEAMFDPDDPFGSEHLIIIVV
jgi:hypothetical protein